MNRIVSYGRLFWIAVVVAGATLAIAKGTSLFHQSAASVADRAEPSGRRAASSEGFAYRPIEQIRLGDRVPGENPVEAPDTRFGTEVDQGTWRQIDLRCLKLDGSDADVSLLRPLWWLEQQSASVGGILAISVPECGIDGNAEVVRIGECPPIQAGAGNVVTGTFRHRNAKVIDLYVDGLINPIGTTPNHRFWSENRKAFVRANQLQPKSGCVREAEYRSTLCDVYNIETYPAHVYQITAAGMLVHNAAPTPLPIVITPSVPSYTIVTNDPVASGLFARNVTTILGPNGSDAYLSISRSGVATIEIGIIRGNTAHSGTSILTNFLKLAAAHATHEGATRLMYDSGGLLPGSDSRPIHELFANRGRPFLDGPGRLEPTPNPGSSNPRYQADVSNLLNRCP